MFAATNRTLHARSGSGRDDGTTGYQIVLAAVGGGTIETSSGIVAHAPPQLTVDCNAVFVRDGSVWRSAA